MGITYKSTEKQREYFRNYHKKWRSEHKDRYDNRIKQWNRERRYKLLVLLGGVKCGFCGFDDFRALQIDHINGGGNKERKLSKQAGRKYEIDQYKDITKDITLAKKKYQILCANCNWIKKYTNNEVYVKG